MYAGLLVAIVHTVLQLCCLVKTHGLAIVSEIFPWTRPSLPAPVCRLLKTNQKVIVCFLAVGALALIISEQASKDSAQMVPSLSATDVSALQAPYFGPMMPWHAHLYGSPETVHSVHADQTSTKSSDVHLTCQSQTLLTLLQQQDFGKHDDQWQSASVAVPKHSEAQNSDLRHESGAYPEAEQPTPKQALADSAQAEAETHLGLCHMSDVVSSAGPTDSGGSDVSTPATASIANSPVVSSTGADTSAAPVEAVSAMEIDQTPQTLICDTQALRMPVCKTDSMPEQLEPTVFPSQNQCFAEVWFDDTEGVPSPAAALTSTAQLPVSAGASVLAAQSASTQSVSADTPTMAVPTDTIATFSSHRLTREQQADFSSPFCSAMSLYDCATASLSSPEDVGLRADTFEADVHAQKFSSSNSISSCRGVETEVVVAALASPNILLHSAGANVVPITMTFFDNRTASSSLTEFHLKSQLTSSDSASVLMSMHPDGKCSCLAFALMQSCA